jgi:hypothetical protein
MPGLHLPISNWNYGRFSASRAKFAGYLCRNSYNVEHEIIIVCNFYNPFDPLFQSPAMGSTAFLLMLLNELHAIAGFLIGFLENSSLFRPLHNQDTGCTDIGNNGQASCL